MTLIQWGNSGIDFEIQFTVAGTYILALNCCFYVLTLAHKHMQYTSFLWCLQSKWLGWKKLCHIWPVMSSYLISTPATACLVSPAPKFRSWWTLPSYEPCLAFHHVLRDTGYLSPIYLSPSLLSLLSLWPNVRYWILSGLYTQSKCARSGSFPFQTNKCIVIPFFISFCLKKEVSLIWLHHGG